MFYDFVNSLFFSNNFIIQYQKITIAYNVAYVADKTFPISMSTLFSITACSTERSYTGIVFNTTNNSFLINNGYWNGDGTILSVGANASIIYVLSIGMV